MTNVESRPGVVRRVYDRAFEAIKGMPPDLYQESQEIKELFRKVREGEIIDLKQIEEIKHRSYEWRQNLYEHRYFPGWPKKDGNTQRTRT